MNLFQRIAAAAGVVITGAVMPAGPAVADPGTAGGHEVARPTFIYGAATPPADLDDAPQAVRDRVEKAARQGEQLVSLTKADYMPAGSPAALSYPSGCGLWVLVLKSGDYMLNSSLTSCNYVPSEIEMIGGIARWRGFWWDELNQEFAETSGRQTLVVEIPAYCRGSGTYTYQGTTNGALVLNGRLYTASAWDQADDVHC